MDADAVLALVARHVASIQELMDLDIAMLTDAQKMAVLTDLETAQRRLPVLTHRILAALQREASPMELGSKSWRQVLTDHLRLSKKDARQRLDAAAALGPRVSLSGQALGPRLPKVAAAQAAGTIGAEHVTVIGEFFAKLPEHVCAADRDVCENALLAHAATTGPDQLAKLATDLIAYFDQDGPPPHDDAEDDGADGGGEAEHTPPTRTLDVGKQHPDGTVQITGRLSAQTWAYLEPILAKYAAPGMCNPADQQPCVTGTPTQAQIDEDTRTSGQRRHDALTAITRTALTSGELGQHNGLPVSVVVSTTLQDLQDAAGSGVTAGGSRIPMRELIAMASHAHLWLAVFDRHTNEILYCGRSKRIAPLAHRIVLFARDRGCTKPGCTVAAYGTQVHHTQGWVRNQGQTNVDEEVLACAPDNRLAEQGWTVKITPHGVEWIPPPGRDHGQPRINHYHHPERLLAQFKNQHDDDPGG